MEHRHGARGRRRPKRALGPLTESLLEGAFPSEAFAQDSDLRLLAARYNEFALCREMGWTWAALQRTPAPIVRDFMTFWRAEGAVQQRVAERARAEAEEARRRR